MGLRSLPPRALTRHSLERGAATLATQDSDLAGLLRRQGTPPLWGRRPGFATLIRIILEQQVSLAAARTMYHRIRSHIGEVTPDTVATLHIRGLRRLGLTRQKASYCHGLAVRIRSGQVDLGAIARGPDDQGRESLLAVPGLGPWSVSIYYLMALRRPDVWPPGDLALADALGRVKGLASRPGVLEQEALTAPWTPWRSVAARLLWHYYLTTPRLPRSSSKARA